MQEDASSSLTAPEDFFLARCVRPVGWCRAYRPESAIQGVTTILLSCLCPLNQLKPDLMSRLHQADRNPIPVMTGASHSTCMALGFSETPKQWEVSSGHGPTLVSLEMPTVSAPRFCSRPFLGSSTRSGLRSFGALGAQAVATQPSNSSQDSRALGI